MTQRCNFWQRVPSRVFHLLCQTDFLVAVRGEEKWQRLSKHSAREVRTVCTSGCNGDQQGVHHVKQALHRVLTSACLCNVKARCRGALRLVSATDRAPWMARRWTTSSWASQDPYAACASAGQTSTVCIPPSIAPSSGSSLRHHPARRPCLWRRQPKAG